MNMRIISFEIKKMLSDKLIWIAIIIIFMLNSIIILTDHNDRKDIIYVNNIVDQVGCVINDKSIMKMKKIYSDRNNELKNIYELTTGKELQDLNDISKYMSSYADQVKELEILCKLIDTATELDNGNISFEKESFNEKYKNDTNSLLNIISKQLLNKRLSLLKDTDEVKYISVNMVSDISILLFNKILPAIYFEVILLGIIFIFRSMDFEIKNETQMVIYSCAKGQKLKVHKLLACLISSFFCFLLVSVFTLLFYCCYFQQYKFLLNPATADFYPNQLTICPISSLGLLFINLIIGFLIIASFLIFIFSVSIIIKNSYVGFIIALGSILFMPLNFINAALKIPYNPLLLLLQYNIADRNVIVNCFNWFMYSSDYLYLPLSELIVFGILTTYVIICFLCFKYICRRDL